MSKDQYDFSSGALRIRDHELNIDIASSVSLPRLPVEFAGHGVVVEHDKEGNLKSAYFVCEGRRHGECRLFAEEGSLTRRDVLPSWQAARPFDDVF